MVYVPTNEHGEPVCIKCKDMTLDFVPICDRHFKYPDLTGAKNCRDCATCDLCLTREHMQEAVE